MVADAVLTAPVVMNVMLTCVDMLDAASSTIVWGVALSAHAKPARSRLPIVGSATAVGSTLVMTINTSICNCKVEAVSLALVGDVVGVALTDAAVTLAIAACVVEIELLELTADVSDTMGVTNWLRQVDDADAEIVVDGVVVLLLESPAISVPDRLILSMYVRLVLGVSVDLAVRVSVAVDVIVLLIVAMLVLLELGVPVCDEFGVPV